MADGPAMPPEADLAWSWFMEINTGRQVGTGLLALSWSDVHAFFALADIKPTRFDLRLIRAFDRAFLSVYDPPTKEKP